MKVTLLCLASLCALVTCGSAVSQEKVSTLLDTTQYILGSLKSSADEKLGIIEQSLQTSSVTPSKLLRLKQGNLLRTSTKLGKVLKVVKAASVLANFIFAFFLPSGGPTTSMTERFNEVNGKLDELNAKLDEVEESIKKNTAFNVFLSNFIEHSNAIENGARKLKAIRQQMQASKSQVDMNNLALEYTKYFDDNQLESNLEDLYKMMNNPDPTANRNIFDRFIQETGCDVTELTRLWLHLIHVMGLAAQQKLTYYHFKGQDTRAEQEFKNVVQYMYDSRKVFDGKVWLCRSRSPHYARDDAEKIVKASTNDDDAHVVQQVFDKLKVRFPWYAWAVASIKSDASADGWMGKNYFIAQHGKRKLAVAFEDADTYVSCADLSHAKTYLTFSLCDGCGTNAVVAEPNSFITRGRCPGKGDIIASTVRTDHDECTTAERCNGNGDCRAIPYTKEVQCICYQFWEESDCSVKVIFDDSIVTLLAELRRSFTLAHKGVPTVVDTYFAVKSLSDEVKMMNHKLKTFIDHTKTLVKYAGTILDVEDVVDLYNQMQSGKLNFDQFGAKIDEYLKTKSVYEFQNRIRKLILASSSIDIPGYDIVNTYKRAFISTYTATKACSPEYNIDIRRLMDDLSYLDFAFGWALILHQAWLLETKSTTEQQRIKYIKRAREIQILFAPRQSEYENYWSKHSCGPLQISGTEVDCKTGLTYSGLTIPLTCDNQRKPTTSSVTCQSGSNTSLEWNARPQCKYVWGQWSSWKQCSASCGYGTQERTRYCLGGNSSHCSIDAGGSNRDSKTCYAGHCCTTSRNKFKCSNGKCISLSYTCDGNDDCGNGDDEDRGTCPHYLRSGDTVALRHFRHPNKFLSCWFHNSCTLSTCPDGYMDASDWKRCVGEVFRVYAVGLYGSDSDFIKYGDWVAFKYVTVKDDWLSCRDPNNCNRGNCPGTKGCDWTTGFRLYSVARQGGCTDDTYTGCRGKPIHKNDDVFIYNSDNKWLSRIHSHEVGLDSCSGQHLNSNDNHCYDERWKIVVKS